MKKIIAIDPGGTTGIAVYSFYIKHNIETFTKPLNEVVPWLDEAITKIENNPDLYGANIEPIEFEVVIEYFATAGRLSKYGLQTIDLVGQVAGYCFAKRIPFTKQSPMSRKAWIILAERRLAKAGEYSRPTLHQIDALAHLLQYLETKHIQVD